MAPPRGRAHRGGRGVSALIQTGVHAAYVQAAYGLSALGLLALTGSSLLSAWRWKRRADARGAPRRRA